MIIPFTTREETKDISVLFCIGVDSSIKHWRDSFFLIEKIFVWPNKWLSLRYNRFGLHSFPLRVNPTHIFASPRRETRIAPTNFSAQFPVTETGADFSIASQKQPRGLRFQRIASCAERDVTTITNLRVPRTLAPMLPKSRRRKSLLPATKPSRQGDEYPWRIKLGIGIGEQTTP